MRGRLWRASHPALSEVTRESLVVELMDAGRAVGIAKRQENPEAERASRARVHEAKVSLGVRGPVWWNDGAPDYNRHLLENKPYAPNEET